MNKNLIKTDLSFLKDRQFEHETNYIFRFLYLLIVKGGRHSGVCVHQEQENHKTIKHDCIKTTYRSCSGQVLTSLADRQQTLKSSWTTKARFKNVYRFGVCQERGLYRVSLFLLNAD